MSERGPTSSVGSGKAEDALGHVGEDEVRRDGRDLIQTRLAELALDVVLGGEAEAAEGLERSVARLPRRVGREELREVRVGGAGLSAVERRRGAEAEQVGRLGVRVGAGERKLDALVLSDGPPEDDALAGVVAGAVDEEARVADALRPR